MLDFEEQVIYDNLTIVLQTMVQALYERDQLVGLAASEFWGGLVQVWLYNQVDDTDPQEQIKRDGVKSFLP